MPSNTAQALADVGLTPANGQRTDFRQSCDYGRIDQKSHLLKYFYNFVGEGVNAPKVGASFSYLEQILQNMVCENCEALGTYVSHVGGSGVAKYHWAQCTNCDFIIGDYPKTVKPNIKWLRAKYDITNLTLISDLCEKDWGQTAYETIQRASCIIGSHMGNDAYQDRLAWLYNLSTEQKNKLLAASRQAVFEFERKHNPDNIFKDNVQNKEFCHTLVALDGTYDQRGYFARFCISTTQHYQTGMILDWVITERCYDPKCMKENGDKCPLGRYHCNAGNLEPINARILWGRSEAFGFRYLKYVADGDCKIY